MIEFFSGIGGMRYGVEDAIRKQHQQQHQQQQSDEKILTSCIAYEISQYANQTYSLNFNEPISSYKNKYTAKSRKNIAKSSLPESSFQIYTKLIEQLKVKDVEGANIWTMSPPCQPFTTTRNAKQKDSKDERCNGFKAIMNLLRQLKTSTTTFEPPKWIFVENVKGFMGSNMIQEWYECLKECGYHWEEYLLNPTQLGIPNNRTRYYMLAERSNRFSTCATTNPYNTDTDTDSDHDINRKNDVVRGNVHNTLPLLYSSSSDNPMSRNRTTKRPLSDYIQSFLIDNIDESNDDCNEIQYKIKMKEYIIPDDIFDKDWAVDIPIVSPFDTITHCFTAGYGRQIHKATGSLLLLDKDRSKSVEEEPIDRSNISALKGGKVRRFTPYELVLLFGFTKEFRFPDSISLEHRYKLVGNSVNVNVVSYLLQYLLFQSNKQVF